MIIKKRSRILKLKLAYNNLVNIKLKNFIILRIQAIKYAFNFKKSKLKSYSQAGQDKFIA